MEEIPHFHRGNGGELMFSGLRQSHCLPATGYDKVNLHKGPGELNVKVAGKVEEEKEVRAGNQPGGGYTITPGKFSQGRVWWALQLC